MCEWFYYVSFIVIYLPIYFTLFIHFIYWVWFTSYMLLPWFYMCMYMCMRIVLFIKGAPAVSTMNSSQIAACSFLSLHYIFFFIYAHNSPFYDSMGVDGSGCMSAYLYICPSSIFIYVYTLIRMVWRAGSLDPPLLLLACTILNRSVFISTRLLCWLPHYGRSLGAPAPWTLWRWRHPAPSDPPGGTK